MHTSIAAAFVNRSVTNRRCVFAITGSIRVAYFFSLSVPLRRKTWGNNDLETVDQEKNCSLKAKLRSSSLDAVTVGSNAFIEADYGQQIGPPCPLSREKAILGLILQVTSRADDCCLFRGEF